MKSALNPERRNKTASPPAAVNPAGGVLLPGRNAAPETPQGHDSDK